jgi:hypothetical protein
MQGRSKVVGGVLGNLRKKPECCLVVHRCLYASTGQYASTELGVLHHQTWERVRPYGMARNMARLLDARTDARVHRTETEYQIRHQPRVYTIGVCWVKIMAIMVPTHFSSVWFLAS